MITEALISVFGAVFKGLIWLLPDLSNFTLPSGFFDWFENVISASAYFLPLADFFIMIGIWYTVIYWNVIWKIITRIWDALPFT
ncbi:hypothetical protein [Lysinibacillus capsici]|uniref:hypothetical protein n=1 Tax=Lysinibacillus capsici TaxID=2115968 RepID=UPI0028B01031|nr:hypothetical protein [Lysinibacillus capsici]